MGAAAFTHIDISECSSTLQVDGKSVKVDFVSPAADSVRAWQAAPRFAPEESPERERQLDRATSLSDWVATATLDETEPAPVR